MIIFESFLNIIFFVNILLLISVVFVQRKNPNVVLAWILVFLFIPYVGFVFYFFFGSTSKMKVFAKKYNLSIIEDKYKKEIYNTLKDSETDKSVHLVINEDNPLHKLTSDNNVDLYTSGYKAFKAIFADIKNAKKSIHLAYYIIKTNDEITKKLFSLLEDKLKEGVKVRIIYDMYGHIKSRKKDYKKLIDLGAEVYPYVPSKIKRLFIINYHYHRKMIIIDGKVAHLGGMNLGDEYHGKINKRAKWRDTNIRITGGSVYSIQFRFLEDFTFLERQTKVNTLPYHLKQKENFLPKEKTGKMSLQIISSGPDSERPYIKDSFYKIINKSSDYLYIQTPYFVPDDSLMESLRITALSGCDVRLMIPLIPDKKYAYYASLSYAEEVMKFGVKVYLYNGFIHSKTIVSDNEISTVGTTNFDIRSFRLDYEINAIIYDEKFAKKMKTKFLEDVSNSREHNKSKKKVKIWIRFLESIFRLFAPLF